MASDNSPSEEEVTKLLVDGIRPMVESLQLLSKQAVQQYMPLVEEIIYEESKDEARIQRLLDLMLDFCFNEAMLECYKTLCRYYFQINPGVTVRYINAYRELWDQEENGD